MPSYSGESVSQSGPCVHTDFLARAARAWMPLWGQRPAGGSAFSLDSVHQTASLGEKTGSGGAAARCLLQVFVCLEKVEPFGGLFWTFKDRRYTFEVGSDMARRETA